MKKRHKQTKYKVKRAYHKNLFRGTMGINIFIVLLIVLLIFLGALLFQPNGTTTNSSGQSPQAFALPSGIDLETGGGLRTYGEISPYLEKLQNADPSCQLITNDILLVLDQSGSMRGDKLEEAKAAASLFVRLIALNPESRVGLVTFSREATVQSPLTNNFESLTSQIEQIQEGSKTCIQCGIVLANQQMSSNLRKGVKRSAILLSDGKANHVDGQRRQGDEAKAAAIQEVQNGFSANGTSFYTIAFGGDADTAFMRQVAETTSGISYAAPSEEQLREIFSQAASDICQ